jgi:hypothetical protein|tara:strand:- start:221 stop:610 length:390 start_codon:yes stop_codon:yes gene_type:complete
MIRLIIFISALLLIGCSSPSQLISQGKIYPGMSKSSFRDVMLFNLGIYNDAFLSGCVREYFSDTRHEIISSSSRSRFYVFEQVTVPAPINNCGEIGDGTFVNSFNSYNAAKNSIETQSLDRFDMPKMAK